jgi:hypothetical protein
MPRLESRDEAGCSLARDRVTGAFAKELMRCTMLLPAEQSTPPTDLDLATAMDTPLSTRDLLTRRLLGTDDSATR